MRVSKEDFEKRIKEIDEIYKLDKMAGYIKALIDFDLISAKDYVDLRSLIGKRQIDLIKKEYE